MQRWHKWWALPRCERRWLMQAILLLPLLHIALAVLGLRRLQRVLAWLTPTTLQAAVQIDQQVGMLARIVTLAAHHGPYRATCLRRSLLLWWWLRRSGIASELRIGVQRHGHHFAAHAWVEVGGVAVNDGEDVAERFAAFDQVQLEKVLLPNV